MRQAVHFTSILLLVASAFQPAVTVASPERDQALATLRSGTSAQRKAAVALVGRTIRPNDEPTLLDALIAATADPDAEVRNEATKLIGRFWIGTPQQDPRAIDAAVRLADDPAKEVRYSAVYYGLSRVRAKSDDAINAMIRAGLAVDEYDQNLHGHIAWGLQQSKETRERLLPLFDPHLKLDGDKRHKAMLAYAMYAEATGEEPPEPKWFVAEEYIVRFLAADEAKMDAEKLLAEFKRIAPQDLVLDAWTNDSRTGTWGAAVVKGSAARRDVVKKLAGSGKIVAATWVMPATKKSIAHLRGGMLADEAALRKEKGLGPRKPKTDVPYADAFKALYEHLGSVYPAFETKKIDWKKVGDELLPKVSGVKTDEDFGRFCLQLVARLEDSHAALEPGLAQLPKIEFPQFDPGFACLIDDRDRPVVSVVEEKSPAENAGIKPGMAVVSINGTPAADAMAAWMNDVKQYSGYSSERVLRYDAARMFVRQMERGADVKLVMEDVAGKQHGFNVPAILPIRYLPRLPVPIEGIHDSADVSWKKLGDGVGYIYVRRIRGRLIEALDAAVADLKDSIGIIIDVRGNTGGGFDAERSFRNFDVKDPQEPQRPRYAGPIALLIDEHTISAGEGWASWFIANKRAKVFGTTTAGASSRKAEYTTTNGLFKVTVPVKVYTGFLDRPIERRGLEPDVPIRVSAKDIAARRDTVLEAAREHLLNAPAP